MCWCLWVVCKFKAFFKLLINTYRLPFSIKLERSYFCSYLNTWWTECLFCMFKINCLDTGYYADWYDFFYVLMRVKEYNIQLILSRYIHLGESACKQNSILCISIFYFSFLWRLFIRYAFLKITKISKKNWKIEN